MVGRYVEIRGDLQTTLLNPVSTSVDGTEATIELPKWLNGAFGLQVVGAMEQPLLQIVPRVDSLDVFTTNGVRLTGDGFVEGDSIYDFGGGMITDTDVSVSPIDVTNGPTSNEQVNLHSSPYLA